MKQNIKILEHRDTPENDELRVRLEVARLNLERLLGQLPENDETGRKERYRIMGQALHYAEAINYTMQSKGFNDVERYFAVEGDLRVIRATLERNENVFSGLNPVEKTITDAIKRVAVSTLESLNVDNGFLLSPPILTKQYARADNEPGSRAEPFLDILRRAHNLVHHFETADDQIEYDAKRYGSDLVGGVYLLHRDLSESRITDEARFSRAMTRLSQLKSVFERGADAKVNREFPHVMEAEAAAKDMIGRAVQAMHRDNGLPTMVRVPSRDNRMP